MTNSSLIKTKVPKNKTGSTVSNLGPLKKFLWLAPALRILGEDFILPDTVARVLNTKRPYTRAMIQVLKETMPDESDLNRIKKKGFILLPGSPDHVVVGHFPGGIPLPAPIGSWIAICKGHVPNSCGKTLKEQVEMLSNRQEDAADPAVSIYAQMVYALARQGSPADYLPVRTSPRLAGINSCILVYPTEQGDRFTARHVEEKDAGNEIGVASTMRIDKINRRNALALEYEREIDSNVNFALMGKPQ